MGWRWGAKYTLLCKLALAIRIMGVGVGAKYTLLCILALAIRIMGGGGGGGGLNTSYSVN